MSEKFYKRITEELRKGHSIAVVTVLSAGGSTPRSSGARMLVRRDGSIEGTIGGGQVEFIAIRRAIQAIKDKTDERLSLHLTRDLGMCCGGEVELYIEPIEPDMRVVLFGAGHVAHALAPILRAMDADIIVVDDRLEFADADRFPNCSLIHEDGISFAQNYTSNSDTYFLVVTHDHQRDQDIVEALLPKPCAWLGLIGSRAKIAKFFMRFRAAGIDEHLFAKVSGPVGLDIGAETPAEIAVSIAAEVVAVRRQRTGSIQSLSQKPIPARGGTGIGVAPKLTVSDS